jgi:hypothetical protein
MAEESFNGAAKIGGVISNSCGGASRASNVSRQPSAASQPFEWSSRLQLTFRFFIPFGNKQRVDASLFSPEDYSSRGERFRTNQYKLYTIYNLKGEIS